MSGITMNVTAGMTPYQPQAKAAAPQSLPAYTSHIQSPESVEIRFGMKSKKTRVLEDLEELREAAAASGSDLVQRLEFEAMGIGKEELRESGIPTDDSRDMFTPLERLLFEKLGWRETEDRAKESSNGVHRRVLEIILVDKVEKALSTLLKQANQPGEKGQTAQRALNKLTYKKVRNDTRGGVATGPSERALLREVGLMLPPGHPDFEPHSELPDRVQSVLRELLGGRRPTIRVPVFALAGEP